MASCDPRPYVPDLLHELPEEWQRMTRCLMPGEHFKLQHEDIVIKIERRSDDD